jgi:hypothetical protein
MPGVVALVKSARFLQTHSGPVNDYNNSDRFAIAFLNHLESERSFAKRQLTPNYFQLI